MNALQRGLWQDDVQALGAAFQRSTGPQAFQALFRPDPSPLRRLTLLPSAIANLTPQPIWTLHALCAVLWLTHGLMMGWIVGLLLPGRRRTKYVVVCLTLTATSDFTTGSIVALAYNVAALLLLAAFGCALIWLFRGSIVALGASPILLMCSLLTMDVAWTAVPFLMPLFVALGWPALAAARRLGLAALPEAAEAAASPVRRLKLVRIRRPVALLIAWAIVLGPLFVIEWSFLHDPTSYAAMAVIPLSKRDLATRAVRLWLENFAPWRWAFARPEWYTHPLPVIPAGWRAAGSLVAASLFLLGARTKSEDAHRTEASRTVLLAAFFAAMALFASAVYAHIWFSEIGYRSHIVSRLWASAAIGILAGWAAARGPLLRWTAWTIVTAFVFFGTWGGMERQDYFLATWRWHQRELTSILNAAPSLRPGTAVILRSTTTSGRYLATEAGYLTKHWMRLLYDDPELRTMRLNPERGSGCQPAAGGVDCWLEGQAACFAERTCKPTHFPFEELVVMDYDARSGTYRLVKTLRDDPFARGFEGEAERYRPEDRILAKPWTPRQQRLLLRSEK